MKFDKEKMRLYAITDRHWLNGRSLKEVVKESLDGGVTFLQLRDKNSDDETFLQEAAELQELCRDYKVPLIINDNVEIALKMNADGVHVGQSDMEAGAVREKLGPDKILGVSARTVEQALLAQERGADYLGVGAVFATGSKADAAELPHETLKAICEAVSIPVVAIGGITAENISQLKGTGICGVAVISAIYAQNNIKEAAEELKEEYPDRKIIVVDSLCASLGEGLFVYKAVQMKEEGTSMEEVAAWLEEHKQNFCHVFTVDDLFHLYRGGRVSKAAAIVGTMINLKPLLHVDDEGHLIPLSKVRGRKKSLATLVSMMEERIGSWKDKNDIIFISHGDCEEDAQYVAKLVREKFGYESFLINTIGATIGTHSGQGTVALFFMGEYR